MKLPSKFIKLLEICINSLIYYCCTNGSYSLFSSTNRGIKQGDSLSLYYKITINILSILVDNRVKVRKFLSSTQGASPRCCTSYMMITSCSTSKLLVNLCHNIKKILDQYHDIVGQKVNIIKSRIYFPKHYSDQTKEIIMEVWGIRQGSFIFKYLGAHISPLNSPNQAYKEYLNKINKKDFKPGKVDL